MTTANIVSMLLEGGSTFGNLALDMPEYTLESGAAMIARESCQELHEIFEVAIVETNEAALSAYMEGNEDVMESATYGPVFEAAEKSVGQKILDFLKKLKDKVAAFFIAAFNKLSLLVNNYKKFYESKKADLEKAGVLNDCPCIAWDEKRLDSLGSFITEQANNIKSEVPKFLKKIEKAVTSTDGAVLKKQQWNINSLVKECDDWYEGRCKACGVKGSDLTETGKQMRALFRGADKVKRNIGAAYVADVLKNTQDGLKNIKTAQKAFNAAYGDAIKAVEQIKKEADKSQRAGYAQYVNKVVTTLSKTQNLINSYASAGYSSMIGRANEAKALTGAIISGKVPGEKKKKEDNAN